MAAYIIAELTFIDRTWLAEYRKIVPDLMRKHGGFYVVRSNDAQRLEGSREKSDVVLVMQFPHRDAALAFFNDPQYLAQKEARQRGTISESILVEGLD